MTETTHEVYDDNRIDDQHQEAPKQTHEDGKTPREQSPHDKMMAEIAARRLEAINKELRLGEDQADQARRDAGLEVPENRERQHVGYDDQPTDDHSEQTQNEVQDQPQDQQQANFRNAQNEPPRPSETRVINLDGQTFSVTQEQFEQLAKLGVQTEMEMQRYRAHQNNQVPNYNQPQQPAQRQTRQQQIDALTDEQALGVAEKLLYGDREQMAKILKDYGNHLLNQSRQEYSHAAELARAEAQAVLDRQETEQALQVISGEYPHIFNSRELGEFAAIQLSHVRQEAQAQGRRLSHLEAMRDACNRVDTSLGRVNRPPVQQVQNNQVNNGNNAQASNTRAAPSRADVQDRKRAAPQQPQARGSRGDAQNDTPRAPTGSELVNRMRIARHQMPMS